MINPRLEEKVVLVTGANHGIGAATAEAFADQKSKVFLHYLRLPLTEEEESEIEEGGAKETGRLRYRLNQSRSPDEIIKRVREKGGTIRAREADLSRPQNITKLFDQVEAELGPVEVLVNNAAHCSPDSFVPDRERKEEDKVIKDAPMGSLTAHSCDRHFAVNSRAPALMMKEYAKRHVERDADWGRIINISTDGSSCFPGEASYGASKHALESYSRSAAMELAQFGVTVNIVSPGPIQTGYLNPSQSEREVEEIPLGRLGKPVDVADVIIFLASEQARWLTGQLLYVGGGHVMDM